MTKSGGEYIVTNAAQSKYYFNSDGEMYKVEDAEGNKLTISAISDNQRTVTDSTGRTYKIYYNGNKEHSRVTKIEDTAADRIVTYEYNSDFQLISATNVAGGKETYSYDSNGHMNTGDNIDPLSLNLYTYCLNNPMHFVDENGHWPSLSKIIKAAATVAVAAVAVTAIVATAGAAGAAVGVAAGMYLGVSSATAVTISTVATVGAYAVAGGIGATALSDAGEELISFVISLWVAIKAYMILLEQVM